MVCIVGHVWLSKCVCMCPPISLVCAFAFVAIDGSATTFIMFMQLKRASICVLFMCYVTMHEHSHVCGVYMYLCVYMYTNIYTYTYLISCMGILHLSQMTVVRQLDYNCN